MKNMVLPLRFPVNPGRHPGRSRQSNMRLNGKYMIQTDEKGNPHYIFEDGTDMQELDGICLYAGRDQKPDYKIISIKPYRFLTLEVERI